MLSTNVFIFLCLPNWPSQLLRNSALNLCGWDIGAPSYCCLWTCHVSSLNLQELNALSRQSKALEPQTRTNSLVSSAVGTKTSVGGTWRDTLFFWQIWWQLLPGDNPEKAGCGPEAVTSPGNTTALEENTCSVLRHSVTCMTECLIFPVRKGSSGISAKHKVIWVHLSRSSAVWLLLMIEKKNVGQNQIPINWFIVQ